MAHGGGDGPEEGEAVIWMSKVKYVRGIYDLSLQVYITLSATPDWTDPYVPARV